MHPNRQPLAAPLLRAALAAALIATIVVFIAAQVAPGASSLAVLAYTVLAALVLAALVALRLAVGQWILRKGGTDTRWFWFRSEPRGLDAMRRNEKARS
jgi:hypothetical protein